MALDCVWITVCVYAWARGVALVTVFVAGHALALHPHGALGMGRQSKMFIDLVRPLMLAFHIDSTRTCSVWCMAVV